jgi:hypothetical protein
MGCGDVISCDAVMGSDELLWAVMGCGAVVGCDGL